MRTCSHTGRGSCEHLPAVLGHDEQLHLLFGRHVVLLQNQELAVLVQEVVILHSGAAGCQGEAW